MQQAGIFSFTATISTGVWFSGPGIASVMNIQADHEGVRVSCCFCKYMYINDIYVARLHFHMSVNPFRFPLFLCPEADKP
jgi:hypothetical protein